MRGGRPVPVDPGDAYGIAARLLEVLEAGEARLIQAVAGMLSKGIDRDDWATVALTRNQELTLRLRAVVKLLQTTANQEIARAILDAYMAGAATATADLADLTTEALGGMTRDAGLVATQNAIRSARISIGQLSAQAEFSASRIYSETVRGVVAEATSGAGVSRRDLSVRILTRLTKQGVKGFRDKGGRQWDFVSYGEMTARTTTAQAMVSGHVDQLADAGYDLVMCSDAPAECERCRPFEGQVLSIDGKIGHRRVDGHDVFVLSTVRRAREAGLFHPNCRHRLVSYLPGITKRLTDTEDPVGDKLRQQQRAYERAVRAAKREVLIAEQLGGKDSQAARSARANLRSKQLGLRTHIKDNGLKNLSYRTSLTAR